MYTQGSIYPIAWQTGASKTANGQVDFNKIFFKITYNL